MFSFNCSARDQVVDGVFLKSFLQFCSLINFVCFFGQCFRFHMNFIKILCTHLCIWMSLFEVQRERMLCDFVWGRASLCLQFSLRPLKCVRDCTITWKSNRIKSPVMSSLFALYPFSLRFSPSTHLVCLLFNFSSVVQYELSRVSKHMNSWRVTKQNTLAPKL